MIAAGIALGAALTTLAIAGRQLGGVRRRVPHSSSETRS
jgi:hypothetical protein